MTIQTIVNIRTTRDTIKKSLKIVKLKDYEGQTFGPENEYTAKGLVTGINALIIDISALTKAPAKFVKYSTHGERTTINNALTNINGAIVGKNFANLATYIDQLKPLVWRYGIRHTDSRQDVLDSGIDNLQKRATELDELIKQLEESTELSETQTANFEDLVSKNTLIQKELHDLSTEFNESLASLESDSEQINKYLVINKEKSEEITELLSDSKSNSGLIENFIKRVDAREVSLEKQESLTKEYITKLNKFKQERDNLITESNSLIESAKLALEYKTAEGISAAFREKYNEAKEDDTLKKWIKGAVGFIAIALLVGLWILWGKDTDYKVIIGRISLLPMLVAGAWFCASQYVKQINLREDYAYKSVLAKSIVGFSEQLKENRNHGNEYTHYIKSVLEEIHKDPLRQRSKEPDALPQLKDDIKTLLSDSKMYNKLLKEISKTQKNSTENNP